MDFNKLTDNRNLILLECISGSRAYGLALPHSDTDIKGVFYLPKIEFFGLEYTEQVSNDSNDMVYYELKRFIDLLCKNNPNILELLGTPEDSILVKHALMIEIKPELFLSRLCQQTFAGYAQAQIKKARGLNKKISKPMDKERKSILDFCFVIQGQGTIPLKDWLNSQNFQQGDCGLVNIPHMRDVYAVYHRNQDHQNVYKGICSGDEANDVQLSSVSKGIEPITTMSFNKDGYSVYCKEFKGYWDWTEKRNEHRYQNTIEHGKNYDAKNMMHVFRLLNMAEEIALYKKVNVRRHDREFLLKIRNGEYLYKDLVSQANEKTERIAELYAKSDLPDQPDIVAANELLIRLRDMCMKGKEN
jgi:uncharacterized protein